MGTVLIVKKEFHHVSLEEVSTSGNVVSYEEMVALIGGYIEHVTYNRKLVENGIDMWVDEEGLLKDLPITTLILERAVEKGCSKVVAGLAGTVLFTGRKGEETISLTPEQIECVKQIVDVSNGAHALINYK